MLTTKDRILFESYPDFTDNTRMVFDEMMRQKINEKYKFVWIMQDESSKQCPEGYNVSCISMHDSNAYRENAIHAKVIISCNTIIPSYFKNQPSFYLTHGIPFKSVKNHLYLRDGTQLTHFLASSSMTSQLFAEEFRLPKSTKILPFGFPRNDIFYTNRKGTLAELLKVEGKKYIAWYPTFRNHKDGNRNEGGNTMPIIFDQQSAFQVNQYAREHDVVLVYKPHPVQDVNYISKLNLSNIKIINDNFLFSHNLNNYVFLNSCDALISDYSSVFLDFLLTNKPIGLVWEDFDLYRKDIGLVENWEFLSSGCEKIFSKEDLLQFINNIADEHDNYIQQRNAVKKYAHSNNGGLATKQIVEYIINEVGLC